MTGVSNRDRVFSRTIRIALSLWGRNNEATYKTGNQQQYNYGVALNPLQAPVMKAMADVKIRGNALQGCRENMTLVLCVGTGLD